MEEELKVVKNSLTRVADTLERIESSRSGRASSAGICLSIIGQNFLQAKQLIF
jgi:hypothetical protein